MRITLGPELRKLSVQYFARYGEWPPSLILSLEGMKLTKGQMSKVTDVLMNEAVIARAKEKADQAIRDARPSGLLPEEESG